MRPQKAIERVFKRDGNAFVSLPNFGHSSVSVRIEESLAAKKRYFLIIVSGERRLRFCNTRTYMGGATEPDTFGLETAKYWGRQVLIWSRKKDWRKRWFGESAK